MINGSLILSKAEQPYQNYSEWLTHSEMHRTPHPYNLDFSPKKPRWSYVMGIEMEGMLDTYLYYKDKNTFNAKNAFKGTESTADHESIIEYLKEYPAKMIDEKGNITGSSSFRTSLAPRKAFTGTRLSMPTRFGWTVSSWACLSTATMPCRT